ncbi:MAG: family 16 glycosylhydrolase [Ignavibacteriaceae bacterium]|nr:family 16 glycosylhydrolase [Ignavibacteriaceae bacterium]
MKQIIFFFILLFTLPLSAKLYKGAEYRTIEAFTYGKFETRMKPAGKEGMLASFFTYHELGDGSYWNEIDIEILGRYPNDVQFNPITKGQVNHVRHELTSFNPALDYHDYGFEWTPDYVAWFIDGKEVHRQTGDHIKTLDLPQKLMMNVWNPDYPDWVGVWNDNVLPAFSYYDWIKYSAYTPGTGNYGTDNNFTVLWTDELDFFDSTRWEKATHTFSGNNCDFIKENVIFENGKMILALTDNVNLGYIDAKGPVAVWARAEKNKVTVFFSEEINAVNAANKNNYSIPGIAVQSAKLFDDKRTVELTTTDINLLLSNNLIILNQKDNYGNIGSAQARTMQNAKPLQFPLKVNIGGGAVGDFLPDQEWSEKVEYGFLSGTVRTYSPDLVVANSNGDSVYTSERNDFPTYRVRVTNGTYKVTMMFAENAHTLAGKRVFDVLVENKMIEENLDLIAKVGANSAYIITVTTDVLDEMLDLYFQTEVGTNVINGLIVEQLTVGIKQEGFIFPEKFQMEQNYPNPFNGMTTIKFYLPKNEKVEFHVFNLLGENIFAKDLGEMEKGSHHFNWSAEDNFKSPLSSGIYLYRIKGDEKSEAKKLVLLK